MTSRASRLVCVSLFWTHELLLSFFLAALEVYVRRAYRAYTLLSVDHEEGDGLEDGDAPHIVTWRFKLGQSNSPPSTPRLDEHE
jgi:hypothetical protein